MSDTDDQERLTERILAFAQFFARDGTAEDVARLRRWLDADGRPTEEGAKLVRELDAQGGTRSIYRSGF